MAPRSKIADILIKANVIDELQLRSATAHQDRWGGRLARAVVEMGLADEDTVTEAISKGTGTSRVRLGHLARDAAALAKVDVQTAEQRAVFPVSYSPLTKTLQLAVADPTNLDVVDQISSRSGCRVLSVLAGEREIERAILRYYKGIENLPQDQDRARAAVRQASTRVDELAGEEDEEFKITDMSGKTVMKRISDILPPEDAAKLQAAETPRASAGDLLDEIMGASAGADGFTADELQRLEAVRVNQEKGTKIFRALLELLLEKKLVSREQLKDRVKT